MEKILNIVNSCNSLIFTGIRVVARDPAAAGNRRHPTGAGQADLSGY
ncbi:MAG: hypothetical protein KAW56_01580 [Candidatus Marinimicrobia bacterium]|nr:hypothetical protein [Candidatus Neomarinimicrobiota bacterium]